LPKLVANGIEKNRDEAKAVSPNDIISAANGTLGKCRLYEWQLATLNVSRSEILLPAITAEFASEMSLLMLSAGEISV